MKIDFPNHQLMFAHPVSPWRHWFAWRPVVTWDGRLIWLVPCIRRVLQLKDHISSPRGADRWSEYHFRYGYAESGSPSRERKEP